MGSKLLYNVSGYVWIIKENVSTIHKTNYQMQKRLHNYGFINNLNISSWMRLKV